MYIFTKAAKIILVSGLFLAVPYSIFAQETDSLTQAQTDSIAAISRSKLTGPKVSVTVYDASTGKPLSGINVVIAGYSAAITDDHGSAKISTRNFNSILQISGAGFQYKEVHLKGKKSVNVKLYEEDFVSFYDKANLPLGETSQSRSPFAVSSIKLNNTWASSAKETPDTYLQGKMSGLNVVRRSGTPSIGANLFLRGVNSLYTTNQPLIVVDGMIYNNDATVSSLFSGYSNNSLENIDIKDIAEITLIKDAGASLYGTKGANGVILITTKRANSEATKIDFAAYGAYNSTMRQLPLMGAHDYRNYLSGILQSSGRTAAQIYSEPYMNDERSGNADFMYHSLDHTLRNTNWQKEVLGSGYNQNYHLNVSGGDNIARYNLSLGYLNNDGGINNTSVNRYFTRFNAAFNFSKKFKAVTNLSFSSSSHNLANQGAAHNTSPIYLGLVKSPFMYPYAVGEKGKVSPNFADSDIFGLTNPSAIVDDMDAVNTNYRVIAGTTLTFQLNSKLGIQSQVGVTYDKIRDRLFIPGKGVERDTLPTAVVNNTLGSNTNRLFALFNDSRLTYSNVFNAHSVTARLGIRYKEDKYESDYGLTYNSSTDDYRSLNSGNANLRDIGGSLSDMRWLNTYANLDYSYRDKYYVSLNTAVDGSSRFGKTIPDVLTINGNKFAVMPSIGAAWIISSESFFADFKNIELLKLRASWGLTGNDDIGNYAAKSYYVSQNLYGMQGYARGNVGNTNLKWETVEKLNAGVDLSVWDERLNISLDVYRNNATDVITFDEVNPTTGFDGSLSNSASIRTNGFDISVNSRLLNSAVKWDMSLTLSKYKNKVTKLHGDRIETHYGGATILTQVGLPTNLFYGYKTNGVYSTGAEAAESKTYLNTSGTILTPVSAGDVRFVNTYDSEENRDAGISVIDDRDRTVIGDPTPDFTGMFGNSLSYRNWSFDAMFTFSYGNDIYNGTRNILESMSGYNNQLLSVNNRWRAEGQITNTPRAVFGDPTQNSRFSDRWIEDGSYMRLRTVSVAYNFPIKSQYFKTLKVYGNANNVFTLTKYLGYDPEFSVTPSAFSQGVDVGLEPQFRSIQFGIRVGL